MIITKYIFDDDTDYNAVQNEVERGLSYFVSNSCDCSCNSCSSCDSICTIFKYLRTAEIDLARNNIIRYKRNIRSAYYKIYDIFLD